jgi:hypothetical protein
MITRTTSIIGSVVHQRANKDHHYSKGFNRKEPSQVFNTTVTIETSSRSVYHLLPV